MDPSHLYLRGAVPQDCRLLFEWANDPLVRRNSFHSEPISWEDHQKWFTRMMENPLIRQYILVAGGNDAGQIRVTVSAEDPGTAEVGYSIAAPCRGRGLGSAMLRLAAEQVRLDLPQVHILTARVKEDNPASRSMALAAGFRTDYVAYRREL